MYNYLPQIIGSWELKSFEVINLTVNKSLFPYGKIPIGLLIFSGDGFMSVSIMSDNRNPFATESLQMATTEEKTNAIDTYLSYAGKWRSEKDKIYVEVITSLLPNWQNKEHYRIFNLNKKILSFQTPVMKQGVNDIIVKLDWLKL